MLEITIPARNNLWDESLQEFISTKECHLKLEHSLISVRKWEERWKKPFASKEKKTKEEIIDYVCCMSLTKDVDPISIAFMPLHLMEEIIQYIQDPMSATKINNRLLKGASTNVHEVITAELIYTWMILLNIPIEFEKWHLEKLLTLIKLVNIKSQPEKKMSKKDSIAYMNAANELRRKKYNTKG